MPRRPTRISSSRPPPIRIQGPREAFARDHNARAYADVQMLVRDPALQVVYIATPHQFHAPHAILAAEHGKHIILEKPMALTLADATPLSRRSSGTRCI